MTKTDWTLASLCLLLVAASPRVPAQTPLQPPPGYLAAAKSLASAPKPCAPGPQPFTATLDFPSKYEGSGAARDQINAEAEERYQRSTQPITMMEKGFAKAVGQYLQSGDLCSLDWIDGWAQARALEGEATTHTGKSLRKWALGSLSGSWMKLKFSASAPLRNRAQQATRIEAWLGEVAGRVAGEWPPTDPLKKINNHYYWAAWSLMSTAVATNRRDLFDESVALYRMFTSQIDADGYLPNELARGSHAADYHNYALLPLAMVAAFGKANGVDLAAEGNHALSRLAQRAQQALDDPASFASLAGAKQEAPDPASKTNWSWLEPYCWTVTCSPALRARLVALRPIGTTRLGGDLTSVFREASTP